jgi:hypothetical protein
MTNKMRTAYSTGKDDQEPNVLGARDSRPEHLDLDVLYCE